MGNISRVYLLLLGICRGVVMISSAVVCGHLAGRGARNVVTFTHLRVSLPPFGLCPNFLDPKLCQSGLERLFGNFEVVCSDSININRGLRDCKLLHTRRYRLGYIGNFISRHAHIRQNSCLAL